MQLDMKVQPAVGACGIKLELTRATGSENTLSQWRVGTQNAFVYRRSHVNLERFEATAR